MRFRIATMVALLAFGLGGCKRESDADRKHDVDSAAYRAGKAAHQLATEADEAAKKAGRKLDQAAKSAKEGWKDSPPPAKDKDKDPR
jgi:hypothetical protein